MKISMYRAVILAVTAAVHIALILFFAITAKTTAPLYDDDYALVMKLSDVTEYLPPPPRDKPQPETNVADPVAETLIESDEVESESVARNEPIEYQSMGKVRKPPVFSERAIRDALQYPKIALASGVEGTVILELFIDKEGTVRRIAVLKEDPTDRGFADAAVAAFSTLRCTPAETNGGVAIAVRYRYPVRFFH